MRPLLLHVTLYVTLLVTLPFVCTRDAGSLFVTIGRGVTIADGQAVSTSTVATRGHCALICQTTKCASFRVSKIVHGDLVCHTMLSTQFLHNNFQCMPDTHVFVKVSNISFHFLIKILKNKTFSSLFTLH